jgi:hypothetical protein
MGLISVANATPVFVEAGGKVAVAGGVSWAETAAANPKTAAIRASLNIVMVLLVNFMLISAAI